MPASSAAAEPPIPAGPLRSRLLTIEAIGLLLAAEALIRCVRFGRWRRMIGEPVTAVPPAPGATRFDRYLARVVERAVSHLPFRPKCLPQAIALHWMLQRRRRPTMLVIAVLPENARADADALHAWTESQGEILIGESDSAHRVIARIASPLVKSQAA